MDKKQNQIISKRISSIAIPFYTLCKWKESFFLPITFSFAISFTAEAPCVKTSGACFFPHDKVSQIMFIQISCAFIPPCHLSILNWFGHDLCLWQIMSDLKTIPSWALFSLILIKLFQVICGSSASLLSSLYLGE